MTTPAEDWARRLEEARRRVDAVMGERPETSPTFYVTGIGRVYFAVAETGHPLMVVDPGAGAAKVTTHPIDLKDDIEKLRRAARMILDTFGEPAHGRLIDG